MMWTNTSNPSALGVLVGLWFLGLAIPAAAVGEVWPQYKLDCRHSGDAADRDVTLPLGLIAAVPLATQALAETVFNAQTIRDDRVHLHVTGAQAVCDMPWRT